MVGKRLINDNFIKRELINSFFLYHVNGTDFSTSRRKTSHHIKVNSPLSTKFSPYP